MTAPTPSWYVHYTVKLPPKCEPQYCTAGPYTIDDVPDQRRDIAGYANIEDCFVDQNAKHPKG